MKTNITKFKRTKRLADLRMQTIQNKYPDFDFETAIKIQKEINRYSKSYFEAFRNGFDAERCKDKDFRNKCSECICDKSVRRIWG